MKFFGFTLVFFSSFTLISCSGGKKSDDSANAAALEACSGAVLVGSCLSQDLNGEDSCIDYWDYERDSTDAISNDCNSNGDTWSTDRCPANPVASCKIHSNYVGWGYTYITRTYTTDDAYLAFSKTQCQNQIQSAANNANVEAEYCGP